MTDSTGSKPGFLFSSIALLCVVVSAILLVNRLGSTTEDIQAGYNSFNVGLSFMVALVLSGMITGQIGLIRGEKPVILPVMALALNGLVFIAAVVLFPR